MPRSSLLCSATNEKMNLHQPGDAKIGEKHPLQRIKHPIMQQEASTEDEPTCRKCLSSASVSNLDNKLLKDSSVPVTQKLKHVESWAELFLDTSAVGDNMQEISESIGRCILNQDTKVGVVQNSRGKDTIDKRNKCFDLPLLNANVINTLIPVAVSENSPEHSERWATPPLLNRNMFSHPGHSLFLTQITKHDWEEKDTEVSMSVSEECAHVHSSPRKTKFQNSHIVCKEDNSCTTTMDLHGKFESYFWAPLNDSSDEEQLDVKTVNENPPDTETKDTVFGGRLRSTRTDSCEKWNPETENVLEIKENKCKDFMWFLKPDSSNGTNSTAESSIEQATNRNIPLESETEVKKDLSRGRMLYSHPLKKKTDQRNEPKLERKLGRETIFKEKKYAEEEQAGGISNKANYNRGQRGIELKYLIEDSGTQIRSYCEDSLDMLPQCGDDTIPCESNAVSRYVQDDASETLSEGVKSIMGSKSSSEEFLISKVNVDGHKKLFQNYQFLSDFNRNNSVLAKYYFYLHYLSESKRFHHENSNRSLPCQELAEFSKDAEISARCNDKTSNSYEHEGTENMNGDFGVSEVSCLKDQRTETVKQEESQPEEQESKPVFANSYWKSFAVLELTNQRESRNLHASKEKKISETVKISTGVAGPKRHWERASIAWSSYSHGKLKSRSWYAQRPASANTSKRKSCKTWSLASSGSISSRQTKAHPAFHVTVSNQNRKKTSHYQDKRKHFLKTTNACTESRQQHANVFQGCYETNLKSKSDNTLLPWLLLPDELWLYILSLLTHKDISRVSQVCHRFYQLASDESFWKEIQLMDCHCLNDDWLANLGSRHPQCFVLDHCHDETQNITDVGLRQFFQHCKESLKELNVKSCSGPAFRGDTILLHASTFCSHLTTVDVSWTGATDAGLNALVKASISLQCISANGCQITDDAVTSLVEKHGKSLKKLEIFGCYAVTAKCLSSLAVKCPDLKVLNIGRVHKVTEDCLAKIVTSMKRLSSLNIAGLNKVRDYVVHFIVKNCPELECLVLNSCSQVTDISLMEISTYLPTIGHLDVSGCKKVTDIGVQALARSCHKLFYLDLSSTATSRRGVCLLSSFCFRTLECVKLSFCKEITLDAVVKLCKNCKKLKILHLYGCRFMPDLESIKKINKMVEVFHDLSVPAAKLSSE